MSYDPHWRVEDERRIEWLEKFYLLDGRQHQGHPSHCTYTGLVEKYGAMDGQA